MKRTMLSISFFILLAIYTMSHAQSTEPAKEQVEALYQQATEYHNAGEYANAIEHYTKVIELDATHAAAYWNRGNLYRLQEKYDLAIVDFCKVNELVPDFASAYDNLGWCLILQGNFEEAREPCQKAFELDPNNLAAMVNLGHTYLLTGDAVTAQTYYEKTLLLISSEEDFKAVIADFELFIEKGWQVEACQQELAWMQQEFDTVYRFYFEADKYWEQAKEHERMGQFSEVLQLYNKSIELEQASAKPRLEDITINLGIIGDYCKRKGKYTEALEYYERALEIDREQNWEDDLMADHLYGVGEISKTLGEYTKALEYYEQALELYRKLGNEGGMAGSLGNLGEVYKASGQNDKALMYYEQAAEKYREARNYTQAVEYSTKVIEHDPNHVGAYWNRGQSYFGQEKFDLAIPDLRKVISLNPDFTKVYGILSTGLFIQGQYIEARQVFQKALVLEQRAGWAMGIGHTYLATGERTTARKFFEKALTLLQAEGQFESAIIASEALAELSGQAEAFREELAWMQQEFDAVYRFYINANRYWVQATTLKEQGQYLEAVQLYEKSIEAEQASAKPRPDSLAAESLALGYCYEQIGQYAKAITYYEQTLDLARTLGNEDTIAMVLNNIGNVYHSWEQYTQALTYFEQALTLYRTLGSDIEIARVLNNIGENYRVQGQYTAAHDYYEQALKTNRRLGREDLMAINLNNIGAVYMARGQYDSAFDYYEQALELARKLGKTDDIAIRLNNIGEVYRAWGKYSNALDYYEQAMTLNRKLGRDSDLAIVLNNIGLVYHAWGQYSNALNYYEQALELTSRLNMNIETIAVLNNIGGIYRIWGEYAKALNYYEQALEGARTLGMRAEVARGLNNIGRMHYEWGRYAEALDYYKQALEIFREVDQIPEVAVVLNNIGGVYSAWGQYANALDYYEKALELTRKLNRDAELALSLNNIGKMYFAWGKYSKALESLEQALEGFHKLGQDAEAALALNNIGEIYRAWGQYDKALANYEQALGFFQKSGQEAERAVALNNIGNIYRMWEQYAKAVDYYEQALKINRTLGREDRWATSLSNIGGTYGEWGQYAKAFESLEQALEISRKLGQEAEVAFTLNNIGTIYLAWGQFTKALESFEQALEVNLTLGRDAEIAISLSNIGAVYYILEQYPEAIQHFVQSVDATEQLRKTAAGDARRDYLASQIHRYQLLISCYVRTGDFSKAFEIIELSRAKLLAERLAGSDEVNIPSLERIQHELPKDTAVLVYANVDQSNMAQLIITKDKLIASERSISDFVQEVINGSEPEIEEEEVTSKRGLTIGTEEQQKPTATDEEKTVTFATMIQDYRKLLQNPTLSGRGLRRVREPGRTGETQESLSKRLYDFLLSDVQEYFSGKTHLLIVPDGVLNFIPFETLIDQQGMYLAEKYTISYAQSLAVLDLIGQRQYVPDRKPLLAFGGAVYDAPTYQTQMVENEVQLAYLQKQVDDALSKGNPVAKLYTQLRGGEWSNLPGTLQEVNAIQQVVQGAEIVIGKDVNEAAVKELSANGELANYRVLHFATHGDADPKIPELSALVLSLFPSDSPSPSPSHQGRGEKEPTPTPSQEGNKAPSPLVGEGWGEGEDGYLRAGEIVNLKLNADFVNLSACETGLGKLYSGEGVVGLTQAFLLAGANGLSVSLWSVADESTAQFMVALYKLVEDQGLSYAEAITEVKRRFIAGDFGEKWKAPYYWAPFVYYGK